MRLWVPPRGFEKVFPALAWLSWASAWAVGIFTLGALAEFVADQLPTTPARTTAGPLAARIVMGSLTGACLGTAGGASLWLGAALIGAIGAIAGGFGGYQARVGLVQAFTFRILRLRFQKT